MTKSIKKVKKEIEMLIIGLLYQCNEINAGIEKEEEEITHFFYSIYQIQINNTNYDIYKILEELKSSERLKIASLNRSLFLNTLIDLIYNYLKQAEVLGKEELEEMLSKKLEFESYLN